MLMIRTFAVALAVACLSIGLGLGSGWAQGAPAPEALSQAVAATKSAKADYAFDLEMTSAKQNWRARYQPGAAPRLRLVAPARDQLDGDARRQFDELAQTTEGVTWCASENLASARNVRLLREDETSATYAFQPSPEMMRRGQRSRGDSTAFFNRMQGELTVTKQNPDVTHMRIFTTPAFSPILLVRLEQMSFRMRCALAPNGRRYVAETMTDVRGSAFGRSINDHAVQRASNLSTP